jgi:23S rRNA (guanosine2251-2'-O)-methyltransferase
MRRDFRRDGQRDSQRDGQREGWRRPDDETKPQGESQSLGAEPPSDLIWGRHSAQAALESGRPIHRIWCTGDMRHSPRFLQLLREAKASGVLVEEVTWARESCCRARRPRPWIWAP